MIARAQYQKELAELGSGEEDDLEIIADGAEDETETRVSLTDKGKGKATVEDHNPTETGLRKRRRRPTVDPFAGYGDEPTEPTPVQFAKRQKSSPKPMEQDNTIAGSRNESRCTTPQSSTDKKSAKKAKKKAKRKESIG
ncbi:hypothetical protein AcW1_001214 [Taiwanofungus camphoratus]|nr:hypothetical protein AcW2_000277 [Antrodia cinnamomea]KAI0964380.1 hypothetical protein AcW1_001214 [Antrodia cinnamomea]